MIGFQARSPFNGRPWICPFPLSRTKENPWRRIVRTVRPYWSASRLMSSWLSSIKSPPASACWSLAKASRTVRTLPPTRSRASKTVTCAPSFINRTAAESPARPAPTTITDVLLRRMGTAYSPLCPSARAGFPSSRFEAAWSPTLCLKRQIGGGAWTDRLLVDGNVFGLLHDVDWLEHRIGRPLGGLGFDALKEGCRPADRRIAERRFHVERSRVLRSGECKGFDAQLFGLQHRIFQHLHGFEVEDRLLSFGVLKDSAIHALVRKHRLQILTFDIQLQHDTRPSRMGRRQVVRDEALHF